ncbi:MAG: VOC family protein [Thermoflexaceae bacterium]|nr:VOC family protein [Thermoflexaceae bacterium]
MKTSLSHLQINVQKANLQFYRDLFAFLGWTSLLDQDEFFGSAGSNGASLWFMSGANDAQNDYDGRGVNHIAIGAESQAEVDAATAYLASRGVPALFETPRHRPEFAWQEGHTYYQVMFESPDGVLFEVVYTGPKQD